MSIDTDLPGKPKPVFDAADWLLALNTDLTTCATQTGKISGLSTGVWDGDSGDAYRDFNKDLKTATTDVQERVDACEKTTRAYAKELTSRLKDMSDHRTTARNGDLTVVDKVIQKPPVAVSPGEKPGDDATTQEKSDWTTKDGNYTDAKAKVDLYDKLLVDVRTTYDDLDTWVQENLVPMEKATTSDFLISQLVPVLSGMALGIPESLFSKRSHDLKAASKKAATDLARKRSRNPAVRSGSKAPSESGMKNASKPGTKGGNLGAKASAMSKWAKRFAKGGLVTSVALGIYQISQGDSPSKVIVETAVGVGAGVLLVAGGAVLVTAGAPVILVGAGVVIVGAAISYGAGWAYEKFVPEDVRNKIDEGLKDGWNKTKDIAGDAGGKVEDAWHAVTPW